MGLNLKDQRAKPSGGSLQLNAIKWASKFPRFFWHEREITKGLIRLSSQAPSKYVDLEPEIYN
jgi:hypothetical protein